MNAIWLKRFSSCFILVAPFFFSKYVKRYVKIFLTTCSNKWLPRDSQFWNWFDKYLALSWISFGNKPTILETLFKRYWFIVAWQASFVRSTILSFISCRKGVDAFVINATYIVDRFSIIRALCFGFNASLIDRTNCNDFLLFVRFGLTWFDAGAWDNIYRKKILTSEASSTLYKDRYSER